jgi:hypothetical protein
MRHRHAAEETFWVLSLFDRITARRFPFVDVALIVANCAIWRFYGRVDVGGEDAAALRAPA